MRGLEQERGRENESFPVVEAGALLRWNRKGPKRRNGVTSIEIPLPRTKQNTRLGVFILWDLDRKGIISGSVFLISNFLI